MKKVTMSKKPTEKQLAARFKPGQRANPAGRPRNKPLALTDAYTKQLTKVDPSGQSYAEMVAEAVIDHAISGDVISIMSVMGHDTAGLVKTAIEHLMEESGCSRNEARFAISLFLPPRTLING
jgi:hypothetical protein